MRVSAALGAFIRKETRHLLRDRQSLGILLALPLAQVLLFGFAVRTDIREVRVAIVAPVADEATTALRDRLTARDGRFKVLPPVPDTRALESLFRRGAVDVGIVAPPAVGRAIGAGDAARLLVVTDAGDPNTGTTMRNYALAAIRDWQAAEGVASGPIRVESRVRMRFNPTLESVNLFVPGLIALILTLVTTLMTAISLSREKEQGTFEVLLVSPIHPWQIIVGKVVPYLVLAMANVLTVLIAARFVFEVPFLGSLPLLLGAAVLFALVGLSLGILIATVTSSQLAAMLAALGGTMLPNTMLSGLIFPIASMPLPLQWLAQIIPARWFIDVVRGIMLKGIGVAELWPQLLVLSVMLILLLTVAVRRTPIRLA